MSDVTIGVAIICGKDRKKELERLLPQLAAMDQVVLVNTSGQGAIANLAKKFKNVEYHEYTWRGTPYAADGSMYDLNDWGFAGARNESFKYLKTTHALWIDTDDLIGVTYKDGHREITPEAAAGALKKIATEAPDTDVWFLNYVYSRDDQGNPNTVHARERFVRMDAGWRWVYPIHECLVPLRAVKHANISDLEVLHYPDGKAQLSVERNWPMLQDWLTQLESKGGERDLARCRLLIGDTLWGREEYAKAATWFENEFLAKHPNAIDIEKWQACNFAAKSYIAIGNLTRAKAMALRSIDLEPGLMDGYLLLAEVKMLAEESPEDILALIDTGGRMADPPSQVIKNPLDYTFTPFCITSDCKYKLGHYSVALDYALMALKIRPSDERAERLRAQASYALRAEEGQQAVLAIYQLLRDFDEHEKAGQLYNLLPYAVQIQDEVHRTAAGAQERIAHLLDLQKYEDFYGSPTGWEPVPWNFFSEKKVPARDRYSYLLARIKALPGAKRVLWVGCEDGFHALLLAQEGYEVVGLDLNSEAIRIATERAQKLGVSAKFIHGWIEKLDPQKVDNPWTEGSIFEYFDVIVASEQLERARDVEFFLESLGDCLAPSGRVLFTTPNGSWDAGDIPISRKEGRTPQTVRAFTQNSLEALLRSNRNYRLSECHFLPYTLAYRENQGWLVAELIKEEPKPGPVIRIFCGELVEDFSPMKLSEGGIGGSETAVIQMAHYWAQMGCQVVVYGSHVGIHDSVLYRHADDWSADHKSDIFISWRLPQLFKHGRPNADVTVLWNHDIYYPLDIPQEWTEHIDVIAVLSEFHKNYICKAHPFPEEKVWVTRNGIDPKRFMQKVEKQKHHYFFSSSHERGLEELLAMWPDIRKAIPDATLHVGYGTYTASMIMKDRRDFAGLEGLREMEQSMYEMEGVVYHGRLNQWELAQVQLGCEAWLYPYQHDKKWEGTGGFLETYCITALEAQAARALPVTRWNGAIPETVNSSVEWRKDMTTGDLVKVLKQISNDEDCWEVNGAVDSGAETEETKRSGIRKDIERMLESNYKWAMSQSWEALAIEWIKKFHAVKEPVKTTKKPVEVTA